MNKADFITIAATDTQTLGRAPGKSVVATAAADTDRDIDAEVYAAHGLVSRPSAKTRAIRFKIGRLSIVIAAYTYGVEPPVNPGAVKLYSTDAGGTEQASHLMDSDGVHTINEGTKPAARKDDGIQSTSADDPTFWTWLSAAAVVLAGLGVVAPAPTSLSGKIIQGTDEVLLP